MILILQFLVLRRFIIILDYYSNYYCMLLITDIWNKFKQQFPNADFSRLSGKGWFDDDHNIFVFDPTNRGQLNSPSFSEEMKRALGLIKESPSELNLNNNQR